MNVVIGKIGRSCFFDKNRWSIYAGDDSPYIFFTTLAKRFPNDKFYFIGGNDINKIREKEASTKQVGFGGFMNPRKIVENPNTVVPSNIIDLYHPAVDKAKVEKIERHEALVNLMREQNIKIDFGIIMQGPDTSITIGNKGIVCRSDFNKCATPMQMATNYSAPIVYVINEFKFPWVSINEDPRYVPIATRDILNNELEVLSQINKTCRVERCKGYFDESKIFIPHDIKYKYAGIEKMFLADKKKTDFSNPDSIQVGDKVYQKKHDFIMTLNGSPDRFDYLKRWVLDFSKEQKIYGKWDEKVIKGYEDNFECKGIIEIEDLMWETKFTYVPCFEKRLTNFVTQKVWKMIYYGIIPFWDKYSYDTDNYYKDMPDYFKVTSPKEMWDKIKYLNEHPDEYKKYLNIYYNLLEDKYFNGDFIVDTFKPYFEKYGGNNTRRIIA